MSRGRMLTGASLSAAAASIALVLATTASAGTPMILTLARAHGRGSVTVGTDTSGLSGKVWLYRLSGSGIAHGSTTSSCTTKSSISASTSASMGTMQLFRFTIKPGAREDLWSYSGEHDCILTVTITGKGPLTIQLRGY